MKIFSKPHLPFWILSVSLMLLLTLPSLVQDGMFMDAMLYTSVSRNLSNGLGTFWFPYFDPYNIFNSPSFHEQPPLAFGIQSIFFMVLGDHIFVERVYTLITLGVSAFLIFILWKQIFKKDTAYKPMGWLALLLWITIPVCFWSYSNNMHENTMGIFILLSVLVMYKSLQSEKLLFLQWVLAGVLICMAALCKGFPGFFPLGFPFLYWLIVKEISFKKMALQTSILFATVLLVGIVLYSYPASRESLSIYLFKRVFYRIENMHSVDSRYFILIRILSELIPCFCFTALIYFISRIKKVSFVLAGYNKTAILFFALGLCGTLPLMLTKVQNGFYFVPALPYFAIAFAILNVQVINQWIQTIKVKSNQILSILSYVFLGVVLIFSYSKIGHTVRDKTLLHDVHLLGKSVAVFSSFGSEKSVYENDPLVCYLGRYYNISLNRSDTNKYYLSNKNGKIDAKYPIEKIDLPLELFDLYKKR